MQKENIQSLFKQKYEHLEIQNGTQMNYTPVVDTHWQAVLKPSALEIVQCSGIKINNDKPRPANPQKVKLITPKDNKVTQKLKSDFRKYYKGPPEKPCFTLNFNHYSTECYGYGKCSLCRNYHKPDNDKFEIKYKMIKSRNVPCKIVYVGRKQGRITLHNNKNIKFISNNTILAGKLKFMSDMLIESKRKITEYTKVKKFSAQYDEMLADLKQMDKQININKKVLDSIRRNRNQIIDNYKKTAESHVARREYALTRQKNKLQYQWNKLRQAKDKFFTKKDDYYEKKEKFYQKKNQLYEKFKINKQDLKDNIKENIIGHYKGIKAERDKLSEENLKMRRELRRLQKH
jgi:hypothetical protein